MKKFNQIFILCFAAMLCFSNCSKTGPAGPQGEQGIPGADGSTLFSGEGTPSSELGKVGDYYIDKSSSVLFGPKTGDGWGDPLNLKGDQGMKGDKGDVGHQGKDGQNGKDGSQILSGTSAPSSSLGKTGDYYWNTSTFALYGPKTSAGWGSGIILRGPQGPKGDKGDKGDDGNANVKTSGWRTFPTTFWEQGTQEYDGTRFYTLSDVDWAVNVNWFGLTKAEKEGVILLYVDDGHGIRLCPYKTPITTTYAIGEIEYRFVVGGNSGNEGSVSTVVALKSGSWIWLNIRSTFLPSIKWNLVLIPPGSTQRRLAPPDPNDYKATCEYYGITE